MSKSTPTSTQRPPIVTIMGHVDHGKTSILDIIRSTSVQEGEAGGITQSIGAYQAEFKGEIITFIDTPGHAAFSQMRARGGAVADIVVIVIAANDGIMPQTEEAISHAKAAGAKIIIAINKIDLPNANIQKAKGQLSKYEIETEEYGGDIPVVETSATKGTGIDTLLETIVKTAEGLDLAVEAGKEFEGVVIESYVDDKKGIVANSIVLQGEIKTRDFIVSEGSSGRVKSLQDWKGNRVKSADAGTPVEVLGFTEVPNVGVRFSTVKDKKALQKAVSIHESSIEQEKNMSAAERLKLSFKNKDITEIPLVVKADTQGSMEVVMQSIEKLQTEEVVLKVIHSGIGNISENDVHLAIPVSGIVIGFNVDIDSNAEHVARREKVIHREYQVIYHMLDELEDVVNGEVAALLPTILGEAKIKQIFELSDNSIVAGSEVIDGTVKKGNKVQILRNKEVLEEVSRISSLRSGKDDVGSIAEGTECGIVLKPQLAVQTGDIIQAIAD